MCKNKRPVLPSGLLQPDVVRSKTPAALREPLQALQFSPQLLYFLIRPLISDFPQFSFGTFHSSLFSQVLFFTFLILYS